MGHKIRLGHVQIGAAEIIWRLGMDHLGQGQVEFFVEQFQTCQGSCHQTRPVITTPTADDFLFLGAPKDIVVIPHKFNVGFVGV